MRVFWALRLLAALDVVPTQDARITSDLWRAPHSAEAVPEARTSARHASPHGGTRTGVPRRVQGYRVEA